jgi:hypothetical protein
MLDDPPSAARCHPLDQQPLSVLDFHLALSLTLTLTHTGSFRTIIMVLNPPKLTPSPPPPQHQKPTKTLAKKIRISAHAKFLPMQPVGPTLIGLLAAR